MMRSHPSGSREAVLDGIEVIAAALARSCA
jgi:hypothetical protein